jgi:hypothetical protein
MVLRNAATRLLLMIGACALRILRQLPAAVCAAAILPAAVAGSRAECVGGSCPSPGPRAVVRVVQAVGRCRLYASGSVVHDDGRSALVLSCAHLFNEGTGRVWVVFSDGRQTGAALLAIDTTWDLSVLRIDSPGIEPIRLAAEAPRPGEPLEHCGYGPDGAYRCSSGRARGYTNRSGAATYETLCLAGAARDGDSGGPVLNAGGELVGVVWGTDGRTVHATYCGRVRRFLERLLPSPRAPDGPPESPAPPSGDAPASLPQSADESLAEPAAILGRFDALERQLDALARRKSAGDQALASRLATIESALSAIGGLRERLERQAPAGQEQLPAAAGEAARSAAPSLLAAVLPSLLAALGWTAPPSLAAVLALRVGLAILRRRAERRKGEKSAPGDSRRPPGPWNDRYARQLNSVYALSGRSATADATLGREYDRELCQMEAGADDAVARWAQNVRRRVCDRFLRIHDAEPLPAEPT